MIWGIIFPPLIGFLLNGFFSKNPHKQLFGLLAVSACGLSFLSSVIYIFLNGFSSEVLTLASWIQIKDLSLSFSFLLDPLSLLMTLLITGVGLLIHLYSFTYMLKDSGFIRYFSYLNLFIFMMLILVLADSLPLLFVGWEGVGLCSYLLIGFWHKNKEKVEAGFLAFITNRLGDACFLLGVFLIFSQFKTLHFLEINNLFSEDLLTSKDLKVGLLAGLFLFLGATGKSAQIPLYFWLPKAMAGPTPVSALIHAATMVTAGVYLLIRLAPFYSSFPHLLSFISWIGAFTALGAGLIACRQWKFKTVLAYSTISQLAYLFIALGVQAFSTSFFHLLTHGFFKALLFLCAGSVIQALQGEEDIRFMGGLKKKMPLTFITYGIGALALMAIPPLSGFFSKDQILWALFSSGHYGLFFMAFATGLLTVFYMTRLTVFVFFGEARFKGNPKDLGVLSSIPLVCLACLTAVAGMLGVPHLFSELLPGHFPHILHQLLQFISPLEFKGSFLAEGLLMFVSTGVAVTVMALTGLHYLQKKSSSPSFWKTWLEEAFFVQKGLLKPLQTLFIQGSQQVSQQVEENFFQKGILFLARQFLNLRTLFSHWQNGNLQSYAFYFSIGLCLMVFLIFLR